MLYLISSHIKAIYAKYLQYIIDCGQSVQYLQEKDDDHVKSSPLEEIMDTSYSACKSRGMNMLIVLTQDYGQIVQYLQE